MYLKYLRNIFETTKNDSCVILITGKQVYRINVQEDIIFCPYHKSKNTQIGSLFQKKIELFLRKIMKPVLLKRNNSV